MDLDISSADRAFQAEVRHFFDTEYPREILEKMRGGEALTREDHIASQRALQSRGWLSVGWPAGHGGPDWTGMQRYLFDSELERAGAPNLIPMAIIYIGPIICAFGTPEQQRRWLPDILESRAFWAQGYSEPEAGSDLARLRFFATRDGDDYVLNGTKIWTSSAHWADWIFCLARTSIDARRQDGISLICAEMRSEGIAVHPIISIDGSHELNRVTFTDVRVPVANRIGEEGKAWHYTNVLLKAERLSYAHIARKKVDLAKIRMLAASAPGSGDQALLDDPAFERRLTACEVEVEALEVAVLRALLGEPDNASVSALKILCTQSAQHVTELFVELAARGRAPFMRREGKDWARTAPLVPFFAPAATQSYLFERAQTIYGGATEVQKTIIWRMIAR